MEFLPKNVEIISEFGSFGASFEKKIYYQRKRKMNKNTFAAERYNDYVEFCKKIYQTDKLKAVLRKKTEINQPRNAVVIVSDLEAK